MDLAIANTPGGEFAYLVEGSRTAPVVLCLHGFPDTPKSFAPLMAELAVEGYQAVAPFMRGYAPSTLAGPYNLERLAADVIEIAEAVSPRVPVVVVGHDWGAAAAYAAVAEQPDRFHCAVTMSVPHFAAFSRNLTRLPAQIGRSWYMLLFQIPRLAEPVVRARSFALVDRLWAAWSPGFALPELLRAELKQCLAASMPAPLEYYRAMVRPLGAAVRRLREAQDPRRRIRVPTLHLRGARDRCVGVDSGRGQERYFVGPFESRTVPGVGHFLQLEAPEAIARDILAWLHRYAAPVTPRAP